MCFNRVHSGSAWLAYTPPMGRSSVGAPYWRRYPKAATCATSGMQVNSTGKLKHLGVNHCHHGTLQTAVELLQAFLWWTTGRQAPPRRAFDVSEHSLHGRAEQLSSPLCRRLCAATSLAASQRGSRITKLMSRRPGTLATPRAVVSYPLRLGRQTPACLCRWPARRLAAQTVCAASHRRLVTRNKKDKGDTRRAETLLAHAGSKAKAQESHGGHSSLSLGNDRQ